MQELNPRKCQNIHAGSNALNLALVATAGLLFGDMVSYQIEDRVYATECELTVYPLRIAGLAYCQFVRARHLDGMIRYSALFGVTVATMAFGLI